MKSQAARPVPQGFSVIHLEPRERARSMETSASWLAYVADKRWQRIELGDISTYIAAFDTTHGRKRLIPTVPCYCFRSSVLR